MSEKKISKLSFYFFKKKHEVLNWQTLFRYQSELADFAVKVPNGVFYGKESEGVRPFLNQQMKIQNHPNSKPIRNHFDTYREVVKARFLNLNNSIPEEKLLVLLKEFESFFSKSNFEPSSNSRESISSLELHQLEIVAKANGGYLTKMQFLRSLINLRR
jgi:hypothetical protein